MRTASPDQVLSVWEEIIGELHSIETVDTRLILEIGDSSLELYDPDLEDLHQYVGSQIGILRTESGYQLQENPDAMEE